MLVFIPGGLLDSSIVRYSFPLNAFFFAFVIYLLCDRLPSHLVGFQMKRNEKIHFLFLLVPSAVLLLHINIHLRCLPLIVCQGWLPGTTVVFATGPGYDTSVALSGDGRMEEVIKNTSRDGVQGQRRPCNSTLSPSPVPAASPSLPLAFLHLSSLYPSISISPSIHPSFCPPSLSPPPPHFISELQKCPPLNKHSVLH